MRYASVCSGIEAPTVAWHPLEWTPVWFSEIEPFSCRLLQHYYPHVPNLGDMLKIHETEIFQSTDIDILIGGTPCQSFSLAGLRGGLADARGNLALQFCRILAEKRPRWFVWENVPGVFSSFSADPGSSRMDRAGRTDGREFTETSDFASIIAGFTECGYSVSWRVLDAQFFGVPQRRRRVFVVGHLGNDWRPSAAVLFEPNGLRWHSSESGEAGKEIAGTLGKRTGGHSIGAEEAGGNQLIMAPLITRHYADNQSKESHLIVQVFGSNNTQGPIDKASTVNTAYRHDFTTETMIFIPGGKGDMDNEAGLARGHGPMAMGQASAEILIEQAPTLNCNHEQPIVFPINTQVALREHKDGDGTGMGIGNSDDPAFTLQKGHHHAIYFEPRVGRNDRGLPDNVAAPLKAQSGETGKGDGFPHVLYSIMPQNSGNDYKARESQVTQPLTTQQGISNNGGDVIQSGPIIRRLTPTECERLQGFPDGYTNIPCAADSPRYKSLGNSMAIDVIRWLGRQIEHYDKIFHHAT